MSIETLTTGDTIAIELLNETTDSQFDVTHAPTVRNSVDCHGQEMSVKEAKDHGVDAEQTAWILFFSEDPNIQAGMRVRMTNRSGVAVDIYMEVVGVQGEGPPGEIILWYAVCTELDSRHERPAS